MDKYGYSVKDNRSSETFTQSYSCLNRYCRASFNSWHELVNHNERQHRHFLQPIPQVRQVTPGTKARANLSLPYIYYPCNSADRSLTSKSPTPDTQCRPFATNFLPCNDHGCDCHLDPIATFNPDEPWSVLNMRTQQCVPLMNEQKQSITSQQRDDPYPVRNAGLAPNIETFSTNIRSRRNRG